jgi:hypothetical protein
MTELERYFAVGRSVGCPPDQMENFERAGVILQERQLAACAAARLCDRADGPTAIGYGGARGGGKSHWLLAQMGADDCQRVPGLKCLLLRKVGKANMEHFEDLRRRLFANLEHDFSAYRGVLTFENGSRIIAGHFQAEKDIDAYLGLEYDVIGVEEATTLTSRKYQDISTCSRTSKPNWRPRIYSTTNPGGIGHAWYRKLFIVPHLERQRHLPPGSAVSPKRPPSLSAGGEGRGEVAFHSSPSVPQPPDFAQPETCNLQPATGTLFIPARVTDNAFNNPEYTKVLEGLTGWQRRAWLEGDWDLAAGQFFTNFRRDIHVLADFDETRAREWFAALDYGFAHYTVVLLGCTDGDGNVFVVDEHAQRLWLPQRHAAGIKAMLGRRKIGGRRLELGDLSRFVAGADVFSRQSDGTTIADQYARAGIKLRPANMDRVNGWAEVLLRLGEPNSVGTAEPPIPPRLFIHRRCGRLIETLPALQHDPNRPEDVLKVDSDDDGVGGDDAADALRYLVATKPRAISQRKLSGL